MSEGSDPSSERMVPHVLGTIVPRAFSEIDREDHRGGLGDLGALNHFFHQAALVVLGEPGMGKTTAFRQAAAAEPGAVYVTVRQFLRTPLDRWRGRTLYLDGLDETRARIADSASIIDRLAERLGELGCPKFRLSCRAADWEGGSDKAALRDTSADGWVALLRLEPLADDDVVAIATDRVPDPRVFAREAEVRGLETLLRNPQTLNLLLEVVTDGGWPATRKELFEQACRLLLCEPNEEHIRAIDDRVHAHDLDRAAGYLAAVHLLSDIEGFALTSIEASADYCRMQDLFAPLANLRAAVRRRMFEAMGLGRATPPHRTISEFMAAGYLRQRLAEGLPLGRVLALMTGFDGGTLSDLRGVYAWLVALCQEHADQLVEIDPVAAVEYDDASLWAHSTKRLALQRIRQLAEADPYFRRSFLAGEAFGAMADPELAPDLLEALAARRNDHLLVTALDIARYGRPLPELGDTLLSLARDGAIDDALRSEALSAFAHVCPEWQDELLTLLAAVHSGEVPDQQKLLRAFLLKRLYPQALTSSDLLVYLIPPGGERYITYHAYLGRDLLQLTPHERLLELADALADCGAPEELRAHPTWSRLVAEMICRLLLRLEDADPASLYRWLGMTVTKYGHQILNNKHQEIVRSYILAGSELYKEMFGKWLEAVAPEHLLHEWGNLVDGFVSLPNHRISTLGCWARLKRMLGARSP